MYFPHDFFAEPLKIFCRTPEFRGTLVGESFVGDRIER